MVLYRTHKRPPPVSILGQPNPVHIPTSHLLEIRPNIIHPSTPRFPQYVPPDLLLLTAWCRVLLEQLPVLQLIKKFPAFHGTRRFITALTSVRHLSLSWASPIQSIYPHPTGLIDSAQRASSNVFQNGQSFPAQGAPVLLPEGKTAGTWL